MIEHDEYKVKLIFIEPVLGTQSQKDTVREFLGKNLESGDLPEDEIETLDEQVDKFTTVFHKLDGKPIFYNYQIKGFLKQVGSNFNGKYGILAMKSKINNFIFVLPRRIPVELPEGKQIEYLQRPLRAQTAQGERVSLARSEMLPAGTKIEFIIRVIKAPKTNIPVELIRDLLDYGEYQGLLQWRNAGYGSFKYELEVM